MSNVPASKRRINEMNFYKLAFALKRKVELVLIPATLNENKEIKCNGMSYGKDAAFFKFATRNLAQSFHDNMSGIMSELRIANSYYPSRSGEANSQLSRERGKHQIAAIGRCYNLISNMEDYALYFGKDYDAMLKLVDEVEHLVNAIKVWRKANSKIFTAKKKDN